jgi:hypothetical protein
MLQDGLHWAWSGPLFGPRGRRRSEDGFRLEPNGGLGPSHRLYPDLAAVSLPAGSGDRAPHAPERVGREPGSARLWAPAHPAQAGGLACEPQPHVPGSTARRACRSAQSATAQAGPPHPPGTARSGRPPRGLSYGLRVRPALRRRVLPDPDGGRLSQARSPPDSAASEPASLSGCRRSGRPRSGSGPPGRVRVDNGPGCAGRWTNGPT